MSWNGGVPSSSSPPPRQRRGRFTRKNHTEPTNLITPPPPKNMIQTQSSSSSSSSSPSPSGVRSFGIDPRSFHASTASQIRTTSTACGDHDTYPTGYNSNVTNNGGSRRDGTNNKRGSASFQRREEVATSNDGDDSNYYKRRRRQTHELAAPTPHHITKLSRTLYEAKNRSKRVVTRRTFDLYRLKTQYKEWPLQGFALDHLDALLQQQVEDGITTAKNEAVEDDCVSRTKFSSTGVSRAPLDHNRNSKKKNKAITNTNNNSSPKHIPKQFYRSTTNTTGANPTQKPQDEVLFPSSPLWSMEPRIFAVERAAGGKRKYVTAHMGRFMHHYWRECDASGRHYYELIRDGDPCRLYFGALCCVLCIVLCVGVVVVGTELFYWMC